MRACFRLVKQKAAAATLFVAIALIGLVSAAPARAAFTTSVWAYHAVIPNTNGIAPGIRIVHWGGPVSGPIFNGVFLFNARANVISRVVLDGNFAFAVYQNKKLIGVISGRSLILSATDNSLAINPIGCTGAFAGATGAGILRAQFINANFTAGVAVVILPIPVGAPQAGVPLVFKF